MILKTTGANPGAPSYDEALAAFTSRDWRVLSDGPSGAQLVGPKRMRKLDMACAAVGVAVMFFSVLVGGALIALAVIDYALLTKAPSLFLRRDAPILPDR